MLSVGVPSLDGAQQPVFSAVDEPLLHPCFTRHIAIISSDNNSDKKNTGQLKTCATANHMAYPLPMETAAAINAANV